MLTIVIPEIDRDVAILIGSAIGGAITLIGRAYLAYRRSRDEAEAIAVQQHNGLVDKVIKLTEASAGAVATGTAIIQQQVVETRANGERLADIEAAIKELRAGGNSQPVKAIA